MVSISQFRSAASISLLVPVLYKLGALARLGLARAYAATGEKDKSLAQYQEFLALWKNADPDLRILHEAKSEYAKLSNSTQ